MAVRVNDAAVDVTEPIEHLTAEEVTRPLRDVAVARTPVAIAWAARRRSSW
ncbi:hypothetical protein ABZ568_34445 [Streptomyces olindensis]|uniref:Uncharacterized protein n=1 Tax=Streptomyces olindensis TaxID=358823 RepID=A0ABV2Y5R2_9ACTN